MKAKKPKRTIYRVMYGLMGRYVCQQFWYYWQRDGASNRVAAPTKHEAIKWAVKEAKANQPSQVLIYSKSRQTGKFRITKKFSYGCDSKRRKG